MRVLLPSFDPTHHFLPAPPIGLSDVASATAGAGHDVRGLDPCGQTDAGVKFDGGTVPWSEVAGFWCWSGAQGRRMFIPLDHQGEQR